MRKKIQKDRFVGVWVEDDLYELIGSEAMSEGRSMSSQIRMILREWFKTGGKHLDLEKNLPAQK